jgi:hypothetical protein
MTHQAVKGALFWDILGYDIAEKRPASLSRIEDLCMLSDTEDGHSAFH